MAPNPRLINYLAVLGPCPVTFQEEVQRLHTNLAEGGDDHAESFAPVLKAVTLERFPPVDYGEVDLSPLLPALPEFCFQDGMLAERRKPSGRSPAFFSFVLTIGSGCRVHIACLTVHERCATKAGTFYTPKVFCLISLFPCLQLFRNLLGDLVFAARSDEIAQAASRLSATRGRGSQAGQASVYEDLGPSAVLKEPKLAQRLVAQIFFEAPLPPDHLTQVVFSAGLRSVGLLDPQSDLTRDFSFRPLMACLSVPKLMQLLLLLLLERKVVLMSKTMSLALLSATCEVLRALLFPFAWEHNYIPILPANLRWALENPAPFLISVSGGLTKAEVPEDVVVFDLDTGQSIPERPEVPKVPSIIEQTLLPLRSSYTWEQRPANKEYWARWHLVRLGPHSGAKDQGAKDQSAQAGPVDGSPEGSNSPVRRFRHRRNLSTASAASATSADGSGSDVDGGGVVAENSMGNSSPRWTEEQERRFRQRVSATFLQIFVLLLHTQFPELRPVGAGIGVDGSGISEDGDTRDRRATKKKILDLASEQLFQREFLQTNTWERFLALPKNSPRRKLFQDAVSLYGFWSQEPPSNRKPFVEELENWLTRLYEPRRTISVSLTSQPSLPSATLGPPHHIGSRRRRSRFDPIGPLGLAQLGAETEIAARHLEKYSSSSDGPNVAPFSAARPILDEEAGTWQMPVMPADAARIFAIVLQPALDTMQQILDAFREIGAGDVRGQAAGPEAEWKEMWWEEVPSSSLDGEPDSSASFQPLLPHLLAHLAHSNAFSHLPASASAVRVSETQVT
ncbi:unnamed protein product, partial [Polarella glacialis]